MSPEPSQRRFRLPRFKDYRGAEESTDRDVPDFLSTRLFVPRRGPRATVLWGSIAGSLLGLLVLTHVLLNHSPAVDAAARRAIGERFEGAQLTGHVQVGWFGTLSVDGFRLPGPTPEDPPTLVAERIVVHASILSLLSGHLRPSSLELRWVRLQTGPHGAWLRALAERLSKHKGSGGAAAKHREPPPAVVIRDLFIDLPSKDLSEAPLPLGPLELTAHWGHESGALTFDLRGSLAEGKGGRFSIAGSMAPGEITFQGGLSALSLAALPPGLFVHRTLEIDDGAFSGDIAGSLRGSKLEAHGGLTLAHCNLLWPRLADGPVGPLDLGLRGGLELDLTDRSLSLHQATLSLNQGHALLDASLTKDRAFEVEVRVADLDMQGAIDSLPEQLRPPPQAPRVEGPLSADFDVRGVVGHWEDLEIRRADLDLGGLKEAAEHDTVSSFLKQPFEFTPGGQDAPPRSFEVGPGNPHFTPISSLPSYALRAIVISEDAGFYGHHGFDFDEIKESISRDLAKGQAVRGGSTLTQQLVKNLFLSRQKKLSRKIQEALITLEIEAALPKWRILEIYLNTIEWGPRIYGIGEAAERYFGERPAELTPKQAAFLATIIPNPKKYYWYYARGGLTAGWEERVGHLLDKLAAVGAIDTAQRANATNPLLFRRTSGISASGTEPASADDPL